MYSAKLLCSVIVLSLYSVYSVIPIEFYTSLCYSVYKISINTHQFTVIIVIIIRLIKDKCVRISVLYMCIRVVWLYTRTRVMHKSYAAEYLGNFSEVYYLEI